MKALKKSMEWDQDKYSLEYDLTRMMIVAVDFFNMGAMENKGLNIFNSKYILAGTPEEYTDLNFGEVERVVGHEYFHNWTGNRITVRDWFQLSIKEGLTVFREEQFTAERAGMASPGVKRITDVNSLRNSQFKEDAGPNSHSIQPDSYIDISNFYTPTVYEKGSEVIRMIHTLLGGHRGFKNGMKEYVKTNDGRAVTSEDFVSAMEKGGKVDLTQFRRWYKQAGTPIVTVTTEGKSLSQDNKAKITLSQETKPTPGQEVKQNLHIPIKIGLIDKENKNTLTGLKVNKVGHPNEKVVEMEEQKGT